MKYKPVAIDIETTSIEPDGTVEKLWLIGYAYRNPDGEIEVGQAVFPNGITWSELARKVAKGDNEELEFLQYVCQNGESSSGLKYKPVFHHAAFDKRWLEEGGFDIRKWDDSLLMGYVLNPNIDLVKWPYIDPVTGKKKVRTGKYSLAAWGQRGVCSRKVEYAQGFDIYTESMGEYNIGDVVATLELAEYFTPQLMQDKKSKRYYTHHVLPMISIIIHMEKVGLYLDPKEVDELGALLVDKIDFTVKGIRDIVPCAPGKKIQPVKNRKRPSEVIEKKEVYSHRDRGKYILIDEGFEEGEYKYRYQEIVKFNPNSPPQKRYALQYVAPDWNYSATTDTGENSVDSKELTMMASQGIPLAKLLLDYSGYNKLYTSFVQPLPNFVSPRTGRVHASWYNYSTKTGRLSCRKPNLQQVPVRTELGQQYRRAVKAQYDGYTLVQFDLSNIELRVLAWLLVELIDPEQYPDCAMLFNWFLQKKDVHQMKADFISETVTPVSRLEGKTLTFGQIYGMGALKCARQLNSTVQKANTLLTAQAQAMPSVDVLRQFFIHKARDAGGLLYNPFGRRLYYPMVNSKDDALRAQAERQIFNAVIQSTASDIFCYLTIESWPSIMEAAAMFCAIVHDEGIIECPVGNAPWLVEQLRPIWNRDDILQGMPILTDFHIADNWVEAKD